ncbi:MAG: DUF3122 domain-containing protein, partial [Pleurocapsa sp. SU_5_0]|nr:DUF3122 domain-containing protein [Pleurocapsa sp. SU_5_0]
MIVSTDHKRYAATDLFLENPPLPSIGQYNLKNIFPRLSLSDLSLEIPLENDTTANLNIPQSLVEEWLQVSDKKLSFIPQIALHLSIPVLNSNHCKDTKILHL